MALASILLAILYSSFSHLFATSCTGMRAVDYVSEADYVFLGEATSKGWDVKPISCVLSFLAPHMGFEYEVDNPCVACGLTFRPVEQFKGFSERDIPIELDSSYMNTALDCAPWVKPGELYIVIGWLNSTGRLEAGPCSLPIPVRWQVIQDQSHVGDRDSWERLIAEELNALRSHSSLEAP